MNHNTEGFDDKSKPKLSRIEQQLKQFHPRAPQLNLSAIPHASEPSSAISLPNSGHGINSNGFFLQQLNLLQPLPHHGSLVPSFGGGCIFYSMRPNQVLSLQNLMSILSIPFP